MTRRDRVRPAIRGRLRITRAGVGGCYCAVGARNAQQDGGEEHFPSMHERNLSVCLARPAAIAQETNNYDPS